MWGSSLASFPGRAIPAARAIRASAGIRRADRSPALRHVSREPLLTAAVGRDRSSAALHSDWMTSASAAGADTVGRGIAGQAVIAGRPTLGRERGLAVRFAHPELATREAHHGGGHLYRAGRRV